MIKLYQMIKRSFTSNNQDDKKVVPTVKVSSFGNETISEVIYPYGMHAVAPSGSQALTFNVLAQENNQASIVYNNITRFKGLNPGDVVFGCPTAKSSILFSNNGDINIKTGSSKITLSNENITLSFGSATLIIESGSITSNVPINQP